MTVGEWLLAREPLPPAALRGRLEAVVGAGLTRDVAHAPDVLLEASERLAAELLSANATSRASALDLLVADSLVTYAFEAACADAASIAPRAQAAMQRIAALTAADA